MRDVYIGYGTRMECAVGISIATHFQMQITKNSASDIAYLARYEGDINRPLNPTEIFLVMKGAGNNLLSALHDANNPNQGPIWKRSKPYSRKELEKYIESDLTQSKQVISDHIIATNASLVETVIEEVKQVGHNPIIFT